MNGVRRIAFVSERFFELQGLIPAACGGAILLAALMQQALSGDSPNRPTQIMLFAMLAGSAPGGLFLPRSYKRTFGDLVATRQQRFMATLQTTAISMGAVIDLSRAFNGAAGPSFAALALAAYASAIVVRDWPWRPHQLIAVAASISAVSVTAALHSTPDRFGVDPLGAAAYLLAYTLIGLGLVMTGLLDHQLLASALGSGTPPQRPAVPGSRAVTVVRTWAAGIVCGSAGVSLQLGPHWIGLGFPMLVSAALFGFYFVMAITQTVRAFRDFPHVREPIMPQLRVDGPASIAIAVVAVGAAVQIVLLANRPPVLLVGAVAAACAWLALTNWRERRAYLLVTAAALAALPYLLRATPARGFLGSVFAISAAFVLHGVFAWRRSVARENADAHTV